jgi:hypothetical protein
MKNIGPILISVKRNHPFDSHAQLNKGWFSCMVDTSIKISDQIVGILHRYKFYVLTDV